MVELFHKSYSFSEAAGPDGVGTQSLQRYPLVYIHVSLMIMTKISLTFIKSKLELLKAANKFTRPQSVKKYDLQWSL